MAQETRWRRRLNRWLHSSEGDIRDKHIEYGMNPWENSYMGSEFYSPDGDVWFEGKELVIQFDMPGIHKEDIHINLEEDWVEVKAKREVEVEEETDFYQFEREYRGYYRRMRLPRQIVPEKATASYDNGVLEIRAPLASIDRTTLRVG
jgi:HSP20 family molecular chaperone IbpA